MKNNKELYIEYKNGSLSMHEMAAKYNVTYFEMRKSIDMGEVQVLKEEYESYIPARKFTYVIDYFIDNSDDIPNRIFIGAENTDRAINAFFMLFPTCTMISCVEAWEKGLQEPQLVDL